MKDTSKVKQTSRQDKQYRLFALEYIACNFDGKQAAINAGYSEKTASSQASRLLTNVKVQGFILECMKEREKRTEIKADNLLIELSKLVFSDIRDLYDETGNLIPPHELPESVASTIASFKSRREFQGKDEDGNAEYATIEEYKRYDKPKALEMAMRHLGMFTDKVEHSGEVIRRTINVNPTKKKK